jgi:hypothetical protein
VWGAGVDEAGLSRNVPGGDPLGVDEGSEG